MIDLLKQNDLMKCKGSNLNIFNFFYDMLNWDVYGVLFFDVFVLFDILFIFEFGC